MTGKAKATLHLGWKVPERLRVTVEREKPALAEWYKERAGQLPKRRMSSEQRLAWREETAQLLAEERKEGRLLATQTAAVEWGARAELAERGWLEREWPAAPDRARLRGRWPGSRDSGAPNVLVVPVDAELAERVLAACWWTSADAMTKLRAWRDAHPGMEYGSAMDGYEQLSAQVTTPGDIWRASLRHLFARHPLDISILTSL
jgi:hypothetical protein